MHDSRMKCDAMFHKTAIIVVETKVVVEAEMKTLS